MPHIEPNRPSVYRNRNVHNADTNTPPVRNTDDGFEKRHSKIGLWLTGIGLGVNIILAVLAYVVFNETQIQSKAAVESAKASVASAGFADSVFKETKIYNDSTLKLQKEASILEDSLNRKRFSMDSSGLQSQILALRSSQRRFEIENEPYLEVRDLVISPEADSIKYRFTYTVYNLGKHPVKLIQTRFNVLFGYTIDNRIILGELNKQQITPQNSYVTNSVPSRLTNINTAPKEVYIRMNMGGYNSYVSIQYYYINLITKKKYLFTTILKSSVLNAVSFEPLKSENLLIN